MFLLKVHGHKKEEIKLYSMLIENNFETTKEENRQIEGIFILGGDGTILRYIRKLENSKVKYLTSCLVIAINFGSYGCLAPFDCKETGTVLEKLKKKEFKIIKRKRIKVNYKNNESFGHALNDILITRRNTGVLNKFIIEVNDSLVGEIRCDSVLISSASGSSGYNYSAKGPFLFSQNSFLVNCLNPCQINFNPLVVCGNVRVKVLENVYDKSEVVCLVDGFDELVGENDFSFYLEEEGISFMSFKSEEEEACSIVSNLWYLR